MKKVTKIVIIGFVTAVFMASIRAVSFSQAVPKLPRVKPPAQPPLPELSVQLIRIRPDWEDFWPGEPGMSPQSFSVRAEVLNGGGSPVPSGCEVAVFLSKDRNVSPDDMLLETITIAEVIPPGDARHFGSVWINSREYNISDIPPGNYVVCLRVDPRNRVRESNEGNNDNCSSAGIRINAPAAK